MAEGLIGIWRHRADGLEVRGFLDERGIETLEIPEEERRDQWKIRGIQEEWENDVADLAALEKDIFSDAWTPKGIRETLRRDNTVVLGIWKDGFLAGYMILYYVLDEGEIARIASAPFCRRQGAAGKLFGRLEQICEEKGIRRLLLEVRRSNEAAICFYKKRGFTEDGIRKDYYSNPREDAVLMSKIL